MPLVSVVVFPLSGGILSRETGCGEGRGLQNPLSLFPGKKRKRLLMVSREKGWAAAFQAPPETPFPAFYGGCLGADLSDCVYSTAYGRFRSWGCFRMPFAPLLLPHIGSCGKIVGRGGSGWPLLFFCRCGSIERTVPGPLKLPGCGSEKRKAVHPEGARTSVGIKSGYRRQSPRRPPGPNPVIRAGKGVSNEV